MTRVLLLTGSRSLATTARAERWAAKLIREALATTDLLLVGDADGPDTWGHQEAVHLGLAWRRFNVRGPHAGWISTSALDRFSRWSDGDPPKRSADAAVWSAWCLARNRAMVRDAQERAALGHEVRGLALVDLGSRTHGTEYTAAHAEAAGITVRRMPWGKAASHG